MITLIVLCFGAILISLMTLWTRAFQFNPLEAHHAYVGLVLLAVLTVIDIRLPFWLTVLLCLGCLYMILDDVWQHAMEAEYPEYHSPLHRLFEILWRLL